MDKNIEILLGSKKNIKSVNVDTFEKVTLFNKSSEIMEYDVNSLVSATEVFDAEREANPIYRIYGKIEFMSLLNGLRNDYNSLDDIFVPTVSNSKNITNSFQFYLVVPTTGYTNVPNTTDYIRYFKVIATPSDFELYPAGFSNNVFGEQGYGFTFNKDFDVSSYFDNFGFPITELFLYSQYVPTSGELMQYTTWSAAGSPRKSDYAPRNLNIGDFVINLAGAKVGDKINYNKLNFSQTEVTGQTYYIRTSAGSYIMWKYNPFTPFRLRYFNTELNMANTGNTSYEIVDSIPAYATKIDEDGNYIWREIQPQGQIDSLSGVGVDYPFLNKRRYLFSRVVLSIVPDLTDYNTLAVFSAIWFTPNATNLNIIPESDLKNIGKPCQ